jgi:phosphoglycolate phosphatase-like HAD superfamily hydrolase
LYHGVRYTGVVDLRIRRDGQALVAELDARACGFASFSLRFPSSAGGPGLWIDDLSVDEAARGRGVGAALMAGLVRIAAAHHATHLEGADPRGPAFCERFGATLVGNTLRLDLPQSGGQRVRRRPWLVFDWGDTLMSEDGPQDRPMALWPTVRAIDGAFALLATLSAHHRIAIATNATVSDHAMILRALERTSLRPFVSAVFCHRDLGLRKSDPAFWDAVIAGTGAAREDLLMVGDDLEQDVLSPRRSGIASVWLNWKRRPPPDLAVPTIHRLAELPPLV